MSSGPKVFRVRGLPAPVGANQAGGKFDVESQLRQLIVGNLTPEEKQTSDPKIQIVPSCDDTSTLTALVEFPSGHPSFLAALDSEPQSDWQAVMGESDISFDANFFGFTQLYQTVPGKPITAE
jgi:hypothetical protein